MRYMPNFEEFFKARDLRGVCHSERLNSEAYLLLCHQKFCAFLPWLMPHQRYPHIPQWFYNLTAGASATEDDKQHDASHNARLF
jgi:hypothetical protein